MSEPVEPKITVDDLLRNPRPIPTAITDYMQQTVYRNSAAAEAKGRERLAWVAALFVLARHDRRRLDPRRLGDRFVERACLRWIARSEAAGGTMPVDGGGVVYEVER